MRKAILSAAALLLLGCSASNCPLDTTVTCNYGFYDAYGASVSYNDTITVSTLLPGTKQQYTYRKLGAATRILDYQDSSLILDGYTQTVATVRRDTVLVNKLVGATSMSLPMKYFSNNDTIIIKYASITNRDTLYISHESYSNVDLPECGTHRFHLLKAINTTYNGISNIEIVDNEVNYEGNENVKIFFNGTAE